MIKLPALRSPILTVQRGAKAAGVGPFLSEVFFYLFEDSRKDDKGDRRHLAVLIA